MLEANRRPRAAELCGTYDPEQSRYCRNKRIPSGRACAKHTIQALHRYEDQNPQLAWYLENRHLLG